MAKSLRCAEDFTRVKREDDFSWAAGVFEGEGTITIAVRNSDTTYRLVCIVGNTDKSIVDFFYKRWGGWVQPAYGLRLGRKPAWSWTIAGPRAAAFVEEILPFLRTVRVRRKAALALEFRSFQSRKKTVWREASNKKNQSRLYHEMRALNRRGTIPYTVPKGVLP